MVKEFLQQVVAGKVSLDEQVRFLDDYAADKVSAEDLKEFAEFMQDQMVKVDLPGAIDICGTGGSGLERINTSTVAAFLLARMGVPVAKHGNKAASGRFGSFDLLEAMGEKIDMSEAELRVSFKERGLAFIYARKFHPVMKHFVEARKAYGKPTVFNLLGPLLNPANPGRQIIGTSFKGQMRLIAEAAKLLGKERVMVVRGEDGLDEVTLTGRTDVVELKDGEIVEYSLEPEDFGLMPAEFEEIKGGSGEFNLQIAKDILEGKSRSRHTDLVCMNAALALKLTGEYQDLKEAYRKVRTPSILLRIAAGKKLEKSDRDFKAALERNGTSLIAEYKQSSPSKGRILQFDLSPAQAGAVFERAGADCISVLTDEHYFGGSFEYLQEVRRHTVNTPLLCKDFIVNEHQIYKAREYGADAVLLIAALLSLEKLESFLGKARSLGMDCLVEVHNRPELEKVLRSSAEIIGINNRDLNTFEVDMNVTHELVDMIPKDKVIVAESGIKSLNDLRILPDRVDGILVGTTIMKSANVEEMQKVIYNLKSA